MCMRRKVKKFKVLKNLEKLINATLKIHRTTTFELYNLREEEEEDDDNTDEEEDASRYGGKFQRNSKFMSRHLSNKERQKSQKHTMISIVAPPYRKSKSYTRNFNYDLNSNNIAKFNTNSVIYEEKDDNHRQAAMVNRSKDTILTEIKLLAPENAGHSSSNRTSLLSPNTNNMNQPSNPNLFSFYSFTGANMSTIEKKQETYCISDAGGFFQETVSPSKTSNMEPLSQNDFGNNENFSEDLESLQSSVMPQKSKASKKSDIYFSTIMSQNQKSSNSLAASPSIPNNTINMASTMNMASTVNMMNSMNNVTRISKKEKKKEEAVTNNTTLFLQNNYFQIVSKAKEDFENNFDKMKIFDVYFPQNNVTVILEEYKKYQKVKNRKSGKRGRQNSNSPFNRKMSTLIKNLPIFKSTFGTIVDDKVHGTGDGNFRKRMMSEVSFAERSKTLKTQKTFSQKLKCKFCICTCCKKTKQNTDYKKKASLADRASKRVSVAERLRRASLYG